MSRRPAIRVAGLAAGLGFAGALAAPDRVSAHAIGGTFQLPVPLGLYLAGAAVAVAASFAVAVVRIRAAPAEPVAGHPVPEAIAAPVRWVLRILGLVWWYGAIAAGFAIGGISPLPAVLVWIGLWVGLPIVAILIGNPWPSLSPFRSTWALVDAVARRLGAARGVDLGLSYPAALGRWPAVVLLALAVWAELVLPGSAAPGTVAWLLLAYTVITLLGMTAFGEISWLRNAEIFEVELGWFGRIGAIGRRSVATELCRGCLEACDPPRCIDCPECALAAEDREREPIIRVPLSGLREVGRPTVADAAFIVLLLAGVTFDGLRATSFGGALIGAIQPVAIAAWGMTATAFLLADTVAYLVVVAAFGTAFAAVLVLTHRLGSAAERPSLATMAGRAATTFLPIAGGYLVAHYLTLVIQGAVWLPTLLVDPLMGLAPVLDWIPTAAVWYLSVIAIVGGHVAAILLAHRMALRDAPGSSTRSGVPMVALMIGYTVLSLWIIAQPIVVEPGVVPSASL